MAYGMNRARRPEVDVHSNGSDHRAGLGLCSGRGEDDHGPSRYDHPHPSRDDYRLVNIVLIAEKANRLFE